MRSVFGGLALRIVKVRRHGDDGAIDVVQEAVFGPEAQGCQNFGADFDRALDAGNRADSGHAGLVHQRVWQFAGVCNVGNAAAHQAFDGCDGVAGVGGLVGQGVKPDLPALRVQIAHHAGQDHTALCIGQAFGHAVAYRSDQRVRGAKVDAHRNAAFVGVGRLPGFRNLQKRHEISH